MPDEWLGLRAVLLLANFNRSSEGDLNKNTKGRTATLSLDGITPLLLFVFPGAGTVSSAQQKEVVIGSVIPIGAEFGLHVFNCCTVAVVKLNAARLWNQVNGLIQRFQTSGT
jgi:hypothetical protein